MTPALRPSAAAHRVLPGRQRRARAGADGRGGGRRHAGGRGDRPEQPVRDGEVLSRGARGRRQAASSASICWCARRANAQQPSRLTLLCQTQDGYRNLTRLVSRAYLEGQKQRHAAASSAAGSTATALTGLIALSGGAEGDIGRALLQRRERRMPSGSWISGWRCSAIASTSSCSASGAPDEEAYIAAAVALAAAPRRAGGRHQRRALPRPTEFEAHEARVCIHDGTLLADAGAPAPLHAAAVPAHAAARWRRCSPTCPRRSPTRCEIARRCSLALNLGQARLPDYPVPAGHDDRAVPAQPRRARARRRACGRRARAAPPSAIASAWSSSSTSSARWASPATS